MRYISLDKLQNNLTRHISRSSSPEISHTRDPVLDQAVWWSHMIHNLTGDISLYRWPHRRHLTRQMTSQETSHSTDDLTGDISLDRWPHRRHLTRQMTSQETSHLTDDLTGDISLDRWPHRRHSTDDLTGDISLNRWPHGRHLTQQMTSQETSHSRLAWDSRSADTGFASTPGWGPPRYTPCGPCGAQIPPCSPRSLSVTRTSCCHAVRSRPSGTVWPWGGHSKGRWARSAELSRWGPGWTRRQPYCEQQGETCRQRKQTRDHHRTVKPVDSEERLLITAEMWNL